MIGDVVWGNGPEIPSQRAQRSVGADAEHHQPGGAIVVEVLPAVREAGALEHCRGRRDRVAEELRKLARAKATEAFADVGDGILRGPEYLVAESELLAGRGTGNSCQHHYADLLAQLPDIEVFDLSGSHSTLQ
jgi:hypothetical protein